MLAQTPAVPERYMGRVKDLMAAVLMGREIGVGPMEAINELYLVDGKTSMSAKLMSSLIHRAGHVLKLRLTNTAAIVTAFRRDPYTHELIEVGQFSFSEADAKRANLDRKQTYKQYPAMMRTHRAISFAGRTLFADCLSGIGHIPEELNIEAPVEPLPAEIEVELEDHSKIAADQAAGDMMDVLDAEVVGDHRTRSDDKEAEDAGSSS